MANPQPTNMIAGYYDMYWMANGVSSGAASLGLTGPEGVEVEEEFNMQEITGDALGPKTVLDWIYQGGNLFLNFVIQEVKAAACMKFMNPWTAATGTPTYGEFKVGTPGTLASATSMGTLQMIPRTSTPAASYYGSGNQGFQFMGQVIGPHRRAFDTRARVVPVRFQCVPYDIGAGVIAWAKLVSAAS